MAWAKAKPSKWTEPKQWVSQALNPSYSDTLPGTRRAIIRGPALWAVPE